MRHVKKRFIAEGLTFLWKGKYNKKIYVEPEIKRVKYEEL